MSFVYPARQDTSVLNNLTFVARAGETTALVGASGCGKETIQMFVVTGFLNLEWTGKSTCVALLLRFYSPSSGQITINNRSIGDYNIKRLQQKIGVVNQEPVHFILSLWFSFVIEITFKVLFDTSIYENIRFGNENATRIQIEEAARQANAHSFIMQLPNVWPFVVLHAYFEVVFRIEIWNCGRGTW